ncbi:MAG: 1-acyl-sn-glycerol-3-phosphate acyltransferase [Eubacteriales bacterium]|nr:1-acyl-sn-glycerol-3-phosphate acyltransferase [Eubacteriales bacterium]
MTKQKKSLAQKLHARRIKQPPKLVYCALGYLWRMLYFRKLGVHAEIKDDPRDCKGPYIIVSNHASRLDYIYTGVVLLPETLNFVAGYNEFFRSHLAFIFRLLQIIPKKNFTPDIYTIKEIARVLRSGGRVILFPEGMSSIGGGNQPCAIGSGKLLKHFGVPVYVSRISGGYLTSTKYCLDERPGEVHVVIDKLFSPEELSGMSAEEIQLALDCAIQNDDYEWNRQAKVSYDGRGRIAHQLHTLLYRCPRCGKEFTMQSAEDRIACSHCGNGARVNPDYSFAPLDETCVLPETPKKWFDEERRHVYHEILDRTFFLTERVRLGMLPKFETLKNLATSLVVGEGEIRLDHSGLTYAGTRNGEPFTFHIEPGLLPTYGMCTDVSRIYTFFEGEFYEFFPETECVAKWLLATEELHRLHGGEWKNFSWADTYLEKA